MAGDTLGEYRKKRDLKRSPEPSGKRRADASGDPFFVIQKHRASSMHYDFRLSAGGALKSWAVPKGPSTDPSDKRLAIRTEDHPLEYADFEGVIPDDEYGGGVVMIWDRGALRNHKEPDDEGADPPSVEEQVEDGHVTVWLEGEKLRGGYALTRTGERDGKEQWLLVKIDDEEADARRNPTSTQNESVASGRTMKEIEEQEEPTSFEESDVG